MFDKLQDFIVINETYKQYPDYWYMYKIEPNLIDTVGITPVLNSRLFDCASVSDYQNVRDTIAITISPPEEFGQNTILLVSGGRVAKDAVDPYSSMHPVWRTSPTINMISSKADGQQAQVSRSRR